MNDTELAVSTIDWMELIAEAIYTYDMTLPGAHLNGVKPVKFHEVGKELRQQYHGRALAAMNAKLQ